MAVSLGKAALPPGGADYLRQLLEQPRQKAVVARILNGESEKLKVICEEVAEESVHRRPDNRRTGESLAHGKEYHDSFEVVKAKDVGVGRIQAAVTNTHPWADAVEYGTPAHEIPTNANMRFPWMPPGSGRTDGAAKGPFDPAGPIGWVYQGVSPINHPGAGAKKVMARARRRYLARAKRSLNG